MKRRIIAALSVAIVTITALGINFRSSGSMQRYSVALFDAFDTQTQLVGYAENKKTFDAQTKLLEKELRRYHELYDIYHDYEGIHNLKTVNDNAGIEPVEVDSEIIDLLEYGKQMYLQTDGKTNIAMGSVLRIWHNYRDAGTKNPKKAALPSPEELQEAAEHTNIDDVIIDKKNHTVFLRDKNMSLDVGSIGKGYAAQRLVIFAKSQGMEHLMMNIGGNVCTIGTKPDGDVWKLGIQNPDTESDESFIKKVGVSDLCVVTSGDYQRYYTVDGKRYAHIIDPKTLMPADYVASVTVICDDSAKADALSTGLFNMSVADGQKKVGETDGVEAMWITKSGEIFYSENFQKYICD